MSATATIAASMALTVPPPEGTGNELQLRLSSDTYLTAETDTIAQFEIQPDDAIAGDDQSIEIKLMGTLVACTLVNATDKVSSTAHGLSNGQAVWLEGTLPAELDADTTYYVVNQATNDFQLSLTVGGAAVTFTTDGSGVGYRPVGRFTFGYEYPITGPAVPVVSRDNGSGIPQDFTRVKAVQVVLRPLDTSANASGRIQVKMGDPADGFSHLSVPLELDFTAGDAQTWPGATVALPAGLPYDTDYHLKVKTKAGESNDNLLVLILLLGN